MIEAIKKIFNKYKELILYLFFGGTTTLINIVVFYLCNKILILNWKISNVLAWIFAVLFAYITNRKFVFESKSKNIKKEIILFFGFRILSLLADMIVMFILIDLIKLDSTFSKIIVQFIVVILNYVFSKIFIFKKDQK